MKKIISLILGCILLFSSLAAFTSCKDHSQSNNTEQTNTDDAHLSQESDSQAQKPENDSDAKTENTTLEYILLSDGTYGVSKLLDTTLAEITIPESYNGKSVTKIMSDAFKSASKLESVTILSSIKKIEKGAFSGCSSLKDITLPFIGATASTLEPFGYIFGQTSYLGAQKAQQCVRISNGSLQSQTFYIPSSLEKVTVTQGVIQEYSFDECTMIKEMTFGDGVTEIKTDALLLCDGLETVSMGKSITEISDRCFAYLTNLKNVSIGENVTKIGYSAFDGCTSLKSIVIPKKVVVIERYAFDNCTAMESIIFEQTTGWYRDYGSASGTGMNVTDPALNVKNLTDSREYSSDRWKRR